jgi:hypothetical protein
MLNLINLRYNWCLGGSEIFLIILVLLLFLVGGKTNSGTGLKDLEKASGNSKMPPVGKSDETKEEFQKKELIINGSPNKLFCHIWGETAFLLGRIGVRITDIWHHSRNGCTDYGSLVGTAISIC